MLQPGLDGRHRDANGEISRTHGDTLLSTLRKNYGHDFASGLPGKTERSKVLHKLDEPSLTKLVHDRHAHRA